MTSNSIDILAGFETFVAAQEITQATAAETPASSMPCIGTPPTFLTVHLSC